ncbi:thioredoxin family protein [Chitinophagales bacterium]|nr:thioredoxin family protein [Chitinophagales bacterium]
MKNNLLGLFALVFGSAICFSFIPTEMASPDSSSKIEWITISEAEELARKEPRKIIVDLYTDWCGWCKRMDKDTFSKPEIADYVGKHFYAVKLDGEHKETITVGGREYGFIKSGRRGYHEIAAVLAGGRLSYPTIVILDHKLNKLVVAPGYQGPKDMDVILHYFAEDHHKTADYETYKAGFRSVFD